MIAEIVKLPVAICDKDDAVDGTLTTGGGEASEEVAEIDQDPLLPGNAIPETPMAGIAMFHEVDVVARGVEAEEREGDRLTVLRPTLHRHDQARAAVALLAAPIDLVAGSDDGRRDHAKIHAKDQGHPRGIRVVVETTVEGTEEARLPNLGLLLQTDDLLCLSDDDTLHPAADQFPGADDTREMRHHLDREEVPRPGVRSEAAAESVATAVVVLAATVNHPRGEDQADEGVHGITSKTADLGEDRVLLGAIHAKKNRNRLTEDDAIVPQHQHIPELRTSRAEYSEDVTRNVSASMKQS